MPYSYGFAIIAITLAVKAAAFPLSQKQVESTLAMQALAPKVKVLQAKFAADPERLQVETARLYQTAGVNPLAGCLPTLATIPVFIGLYRALSNVADEGLLTEGFFWIPSLAGPVAVNGGTGWLSLVDGAPPLGWADTAKYLALPVALVISQFLSQKIISPPPVRFLRFHFADLFLFAVSFQSPFFPPRRYALSLSSSPIPPPPTTHPPAQSDDPQQQQTQAILKFLPLMIGWFALSVPSGLTLYWFTNNLVTTAQQVYLRKSFEAKQAAEAAAGPAPNGAGVIDVEGTYVKPKELGGGAPAKPSGRETGARKRRADGGGSDASDAEDGAAVGGGGEESAGARGERFRALKAREAAARARALAEPAAAAAPPAADGELAVSDAPPAKDGGGAAGGAKKVVKKVVKRR